MAEYITDVITPAELTGFVRTEIQGGMPFAGVAGQGVEPVTLAPAPGSQPPLNLFPVQPTEDIMYELENSDMTGQAEVARYRSWDVPVDIGKRPGISIIGGAIPPLGWGYMLNEKDLVRFSRLREGVASLQDAEVANVMLNDGVRAGAAVQNRITLLHAELLTTGTTTLTELGDPVSGQAVVATFPVPGTNVVTAGTLWSDATNADPAANLLAWEQVYADANNGELPDAWLISPTVATNLLNSAKLKNNLVLTIGTSNLTALPNMNMVNDILRIQGVQAPLRITNVRRPALAGGALTSVLATRKVIGVKAGMGKTLFTRTVTEGLLPMNGRLERTLPPGIIVYGTSDISPPEVHTRAEAVSIPVLTNPRALFIATV
jgi:hypothetical protein